MESLGSTETRSVPRRTPVVMTVRHVLAAGLVSVALVGCGSTDPDSGAGGAGGTGGFGGVPVSDYQDNFVPLARMDGSTFVEVLEVKARQDGWVFFCLSLIHI